MSAFKKTLAFAALLFLLGAVAPRNAAAVCVGTENFALPAWTVSAADYHDGANATGVAVTGLGIYPVTMTSSHGIRNVEVHWKIKPNGAALAKAQVRFTIESSSDGLGWTTLTTDQFNKNPVLPGGVTYNRQYILPNDSTDTFFRVRVTLFNVTKATVQLSEVMLWGCASTTATSTPTRTPTITPTATLTATPTASPTATTTCAAWVPTWRRVTVLMPDTKRNCGSSYSPPAGGTSLDLPLAAGTYRVSLVPGTCTLYNGSGLTGASFQWGSYKGGAYDYIGSVVQSPAIPGGNCANIWAPGGTTIASGGDTVTLPAGSGLYFGISDSPCDDNDAGVWILVERQVMVEMPLNCWSATPSSTPVETATVTPSYTPSPTRTRTCEVLRNAALPPNAITKRNYNDDNPKSGAVMAGRATYPLTLVTGRDVESIQVQWDLHRNGGNSSIQASYVIESSIDGTTWQQRATDSINYAPVPSPDASITLSYPMPGLVNDRFFRLRVTSITLTRSRLRLDELRLFYCDPATPTTTPSSTPSSTTTASPSQTPSVTPTETETATPSATETATTTSSPTASPTPTPTATRACAPLVRLVPLQIVALNAINQCGLVYNPATSIGVLLPPGTYQVDPVANFCTVYNGNGTGPLVGAGFRWGTLDGAGTATLIGAVFQQPVPAGPTTCLGVWSGGNLTVGPNQVTLTVPTTLFFFIGDGQCGDNGGGVQVQIQQVFIDDCETPTPTTTPTATATGTGTATASPTETQTMSPSPTETECIPAGICRFTLAQVYAGAGSGIDLGQAGAVAQLPGGDVLVYSSAEVALHRFSASGADLGIFTVAGVSPGIVRSLHVDAGGNVWIGSTDHLYKADASGNLLAQVGGSSGAGSGPDEFSNPMAITSDPLGNIYVGETGNERLKKYDSALNLVWITAVGSYGNYGDRPNSLAYDAMHGVLWLGSGGPTINQVDPSTGVLVSSFADQGLCGRFAGGYTNVAVDAAGNLYSAAMGGQLIHRYASAGLPGTQLHDALIAGYPGTAGANNMVLGLAWTASGQLLASDTRGSGASRVLLYSPCVVPTPTPSPTATPCIPDGICRFTLAKAYGGPGGSFDFGAQTGPVAQLPGGDVIVYNTNDGDIRRFSAAGADLGLFTVGGQTAGMVRGLNVDAFGNVWILNEGRLMKADAAGNLLGVLTDNGSPPYPFSQAWSVTSDPAGNVYVGDIGSGQIKKFDSNLNLVWATAPGSYSGYTGQPYSLAFDAVHQVLWVGSGEAIFDTDPADGSFRNSFRDQSLCQMGARGRSNVAVDPAGNLYVAALSGPAIHRYASASLPAALVHDGLIAGYPGTDMSNHIVLGIAWAASGQLLVSNSGGAVGTRVLLFDPCAPPAGPASSVLSAARALADTLRGNPKQKERSLAFGPVPARSGQPVCLEASQELLAGADVYNLVGERVAHLGQGERCWNTEGKAMGIYFILADLQSPDGQHRTLRQKVALVGR